MDESSSAHDSRPAVHSFSPSIGTRHSSGSANSFSMSAMTSGGTCWAYSQSLRVSLAISTRSFEKQGCKNEKDKVDEKFQVVFHLSPRSNFSNSMAFLAKGF